MSIRGTLHEYVTNLEAGPTETECVCSVCDPIVHLGAPSICFVCVFVYISSFLFIECFDSGITGVISLCDFVSGKS